MCSLNDLQQYTHKRHSETFMIPPAGVLPFEGDPLYLPTQIYSQMVGLVPVAVLPFQSENNRENSLTENVFAVSFLPAFANTLLESMDKSESLIPIPKRDHRFETRIMLAGNIKFLEDEELLNHFSKFGEVEAAYAVKDLETGELKGFAYVDFKEEESARKALKEGNTRIREKWVQVKEIPSKGRKKIDRCRKGEKYVEYDPSFGRSAPANFDASENDSLVDEINYVVPGASCLSRPANFTETAQDDGFKRINSLGNQKRMYLDGVGLLNPGVRNARSSVRRDTWNLPLKSSEKGGSKMKGLLAISLELDHSEGQVVFRKAVELRQNELQETFEDLKLTQIERN